jgi:hypothetical protein
MPARLHARAPARSEALETRCWFTQAPTKHADVERTGPADSYVDMSYNGLHAGAVAAAIVCTEHEEPPVGSSGGAQRQRYDNSRKLTANGFHIRTQRPRIWQYASVRALISFPSLQTSFPQPDGRARVRKLQRTHRRRFGVGQAKNDLSVPCVELCERPAAVRMLCEDLSLRCGLCLTNHRAERQRSAQT